MLSSSLLLLLPLPLFARSPSTPLCRVAWSRSVWQRSQNMWHLWHVCSISTSATSIFPELLQAGRHRLVGLRAELLACAPPALVLADARLSALFACAPDALVLADARHSLHLSQHWPLMRWCSQMLTPPHSLHLVIHLLLCRWCWQMPAPPALLACAPDALVLADARPPALLAFAPFALVLADARPPESHSLHLLLTSESVAA